MSLLDQKLFRDFLVVMLTLTFCACNSERRDGIEAKEEKTDSSDANAVPGSGNAEGSDEDSGLASGETDTDPDPGNNQVDTPEQCRDRAGQIIPAQYVNQGTTPATVAPTVKLVDCYDAQGQLV